MTKFIIQLNSNGGYRGIVTIYTLLASVHASM